MAEADWTIAQDSLDANTVRRGSIQGITPPNGGGDFVYGFNSIDTSQGAVGVFHTGNGFVPCPLGASARGGIQKGASGGDTDYQPFLFVALQGESVNDDAYMLGVSNNDPHKIALAKGPLSIGITETAILRESSANHEIGTWHHLRIDAVANENGDVVLNVSANDLSANPLSGAPTWESIAGMAEFVDDALGINSGSLPLVGGRAGFGFWTKQVTRRGYIAHVELLRQLAA